MAQLTIGKDVDSWMVELSTLVTDCLRLPDNEVRMRLSWVPPREDASPPRWELHVCEMPTELIGGRRDGHELILGTVLDVTKLLMLLDAQGSFTVLLSSLVVDSEDYDACVPRLLFTGSYRQRELLLAVYTEPLSDVPVGQRLTQAGVFIQATDDPDAEES
jgi:hypothetical protein